MQAFVSFFFYLANVWVKRRYVYIESGQGNSFCDLYAGPVFNLQKEKKKSYFYSAFHISRIFVDLFDISTNFKINGSHVCTVFSGLSYKVRFSKALRELFTCSLKPLFFSGL